MKRYELTLFFLMLFSLFFACTPENYREIDQGVIITLSPSDESVPNLVKIEVASDRIFRVCATPDSEFPLRNSLIIVPRDNGSIPFSVKEVDDSVVISTDKISAAVSLENGGIQFFDDQGNLLLQEKAGGGKTFSPITVDNTSGYSFRQVFDSPGDEAFYGLGQHQSDEWNY